MEQARLDIQIENAGDRRNKDRNAIFKKQWNQKDAVLTIVVKDLRDFIFSCRSKSRKVIQVNRTRFKGALSVYHSNHAFDETAIAWLLHIHRSNNRACLV